MSWSTPKTSPGSHTRGDQSQHCFYTMENPSLAEWKPPTHGLPLIAKMDTSSCCWPDQGVCNFSYGCVNMLDFVSIVTDLIKTDSILLKETSNCLEKNLRTINHGLCIAKFILKSFSFLTVVGYICRYQRNRTFTWKQKREFIECRSSKLS